MASHSQGRFLSLVSDAGVVVTDFVEEPSAGFVKVAVQVRLGV